MTTQDITPARPAPRLTLPVLAPRTSALAAMAVGLAVVVYVSRYDGLSMGGAFALAVCAALAALVVAAGRRVLFAASVIAMLVALIHIVSRAKQNATDIILHSYDLVRLATSWETARHLVTAHPGDMAALAGLLAAAIVGGTLAWRLDGTRISRRNALLAFLAAAGLATATAELKGPRRHTELFFEDIYLSTFLSSFSDTAEVILRGSLMEAAAQSSTPFAAPGPCTAGPDAPTIILIHQESVVPPSYFKGLDYDRGLDAMLRSFDERIHRLRVHTYGGASWLTEFSVLTGLSSEAFGGMRQAVQQVMAGRVGETLPLTLARCGYRTQMYYPMLKSFMSAGRFFHSTGIAEIRDARDQGAKRANERDRFYFDGLLGEIERHFTTRQGPMFAFVETMATHGGYGWLYDEEVEVPGGGPGTPPLMHEYLRRLGMSAIDNAYLRAELARRFPGKPFLIVHYGDHHPTATQTLMGFPPAADIEEVLAGDNPLRLETYFAVQPVGFTPPPLPLHELVDVTYLSSIILASARLPLSDVTRERLRLMDVCGGAYLGCARRDEIMLFHRRLIDSGIVARR